MLDFILTANCLVSIFNCLFSHIFTIWWLNLNITEKCKKVIVLIIPNFSAATCAYIVAKLFEISIQDPTQDPMDLLLVRYYIFMLTCIQACGSTSQVFFSYFWVCCFLVFLLSFSLRLLSFSFSFFIKMMNLCVNWCCFPCWIYQL